MTEKRGPIVLLTEVDDSVRLNPHTEAGSDCDIRAERFLSRRSRCPVLAAGDKNYRGKGDSTERPRTLHNSSSGNGLGKAGNRRLIISVMGERRATPADESHRHARRVAVAE